MCTRRAACNAAVRTCFSRRVAQGFPALSLEALYALALVRCERAVFFNRAGRTFYAALCGAFGALCPLMLTHLAIGAALVTIVALAAAAFYHFRRPGATSASKRTGPQALIVLSTQSFQVPCIAAATASFKEAGLQVAAADACSKPHLALNPRCSSSGELCDEHWRRYAA